PAGFGDLVLPTLSIAVRPLSVSVQSLTIAAPLTDRARVQGWLETNVLADAGQHLAGLLDPAALPVFRKFALPYGIHESAEVAELVQELVTLHQAPHGFTLHPTLEWRVKSGWVSWDLAFDDRLDELFT